MSRPTLPFDYLPPNGAAALFDLDTPITVRYHRQAVDEIVRSVEEGVYCALLGPRLSGKTILLRYVEQQVAPGLGWSCAYIDLTGIRSATLQSFFAGLIRLAAERLVELGGQALPVPDETEASSAAFRGFLADSLQALGRDLVLIIDPLEALPLDMVQALLTSLRAAYMDQQDLDYHMTVIVSGALSLAGLTVGESSPFRGIARRVFVGDLSESQSRALIGEFIAGYGVNATPQAMHRLLQATNGDIYLIRKISQRCAELLAVRREARLKARHVAQVAGRFLRDEVFQYAPLLEAVRLIEDDPELLNCILLLLEHGSYRRSELPLPLSPDLDPLFLTGVVDLAGEDCYRLQNGIYSQFLQKHFDHGRVGHMLAMAGRWDGALDYLEMGVQEGDPQARADLLPAAINSMYAAHDLAQAAHFLRRGLSAIFNVREAWVWYAPPGENHLRLVGAASSVSAAPLSEMPLSADLLEARAFRQKSPQRGLEGERRVARALPLLAPGRNPVGVVTIYEELGEGRFSEQREHDLQVNGYLSQAARALQTVGLRRQELVLAGRMQASLLPESIPQPPGWQITAVWRPARETSGDFYDFIHLPVGRTGILVADVVDKGMGAALYMALARTLVRTYAADYPDRPDLALRAVNRRLITDANIGHFVTTFYGVLDAVSGKLVYCNAGHHPPQVLLPPRGKEAGQTLSLRRTGMALGVSDEGHWQREAVDLPPGSALLLYTDGLVDAHNPQGEAFGIERMLEVAQNQALSAQELQDALLGAVSGFAGEAGQFDDLTLVVVKRG